MIYIDFFGGLHGHFLEYSINALDPRIKPYSPFNKLGNSHNPFPRVLAKADHYTFFNKQLPDASEVIEIRVTVDDCLLINLLSFSRAGDYNFDLYSFDKNFSTKVRNTEFYEGFRQSLLHYNIDIDADDIVPKCILRESLKFNFTVPAQNSLMSVVNTFHYSKNAIPVYIRQLYNKQTYLDLMEQIVQRYQLPYNVDQDWYSALWTEFIERNKVIQDEQYAKDILQAVVDKTEMEIRLNIIQEAWLDAELERLYNIEMPAEQDVYFLNTIQINQYLKRL
jgi:hypothetical protein